MARKSLRTYQIHLFLFFCLLASGCAGTGGGPSILTDGIHHVLRDPPPERVQDFPVADRSGVMVRDDVKGGYGMVRRMYIPQTLFPGKFNTDEPVLALNYVLLDWQAASGTGGNFKYALLNQGDLSPFKKLAPIGKTCQDCLNRLPTQPNRQDPFFQPIRAKIGNRDYNLVNDRFHSPKNDGGIMSAATLEIYDGDPAGGGARPAAVWVVGSKDRAQANWQFQAGPWPLKTHFFMITDMQTDPLMDNRVTKLAISQWEPKLNDILEGKTSADFLPRPYLRDAARTNANLEAYLNETLIDWKARGFPDLLQNSNGANLRDLAVKLEKTILKLDLKAKELKDAADEDARKPTAPGQAAPAKTAPAGALKTAHLLEQRKTILMVLLQPIKQAAMQKGG